MSGALDAVLADPTKRTRHEIRVQAPLAATWAAVESVTPAELRITGTLMAIRRLPARLLCGGGQGGPLDDPDGPVVAQFQAAGFGVLQRDAPRLLSIGTAGQPWKPSGGGRLELDGPEAYRAFDRPGFVLMAMSFELADDGAGGTRLATETRVRPTDAHAAAAFRRYWTLIRLGSVAIRHDLLWAIRRRAEHTT